MNLPEIAAELRARAAYVETHQWVPDTPTAIGECCAGWDGIGQDSRMALSWPAITAINDYLARPDGEDDVLLAEWNDSLDPDTGKQTVVDTLRAVASHLEAECDTP